MGGKILFITAAFLAFVNSSCDNERTTIVEGKVVNFGSREPIEGVKVMLGDGVGQSGDFYIGFTTSSGKRRTALTDSHGNFKVQITGKFEAWLGLAKEGYEFTPEGGAGITSFPEGTNKNVILELKAKAYFYPVFVNGGAAPCDTLRVFTTKFNSPIKFAKTPDTEFIGEGPYKYDTYKSDFFIGDVCTYYKLEFKRNDVWGEKIDSVFIKSFETFSGEIIF